MKTKIKKSEKNILTSCQLHHSVPDEKNEFEKLLTELLIESKIGQLLEERKDGNYGPIPKKQMKLVERLQTIIHDAYGDTSNLAQAVDQWIKLVSLNIEEENRIGNQEYSDLLFFLFTFKETIQDSGADGNLINELLHFIYHLFDRKHLIEDIACWIRFVTLCTEKENYTGSEEYLELINFLYIFKDGLQNKKLP